MGVYYQSSYYIAKRPVYKAETVHFDRFCYDLISLFGVNLLFIELEQLQDIIRKIYSTVSFTQDGVVMLLATECIKEAFTDEQLNEAS